MCAHPRVHRDSAHILAYAHPRNDVIFLSTGLHTNYFPRQTGGVILLVILAAERDDSLDGFKLFLATILSNLQSLHIGRRMSVQKMLRKRIPLHPSWNYIIFTRMDR